MERYQRFLPISAATPALTLGEGATPLVAAPRLGAAIGAPNLHLKVEGQNPTGSFKDRGMVVAVTKAVEAGARVVAIDGNFDEALAIVRGLAEQDDHPVTLVNSVNPYRLDGQATAAYEICDDLGRAPDILAIPVGNAGNISAYWQGFQAYAAAGVVGATPRMWGFQAAGAAPLVLGRRVDHPETVATAIRIGDPASWELAVAARDASGGRIESVTDDEILAAYRDLARHEGVFCEPASAASVAGLRRLAAARQVDPEATVVAVLTGHGLKDPHTAEQQVPPVLEAEPTIGSVAVALGWS
jgi:threonine synthase